MLLYIFEQSALCYTVANQSIFLKWIYFRNENIFPNENTLIAVGQLCQVMGKHVTKKIHLFMSVVIKINWNNKH